MLLTPIVAALLVVALIRLTGAGAYSLDAPLGLATAHVAPFLVVLAVSPLITVAAMRRAEPLPAEKHKAA